MLVSDESTIQPSSSEEVTLDSLQLNTSDESGQDTTTTTESSFLSSDGSFYQTSNFKHDENTSNTLLNSLASDLLQMYISMHTNKMDLCWPKHPSNQLILTCPIGNYTV